MYRKLVIRWKCFFIFLSLKIFMEQINPIKKKAINLLINTK